MDRATVVDVFPEVELIDDTDLRTGVLDVWVSVLEATGHEDIREIQWLPPEQDRLGLGDEPQVDHIRDVTRGAIELAEIAAERGAAVSMDTVIAGGLLHDISKPFEFDPDADDGVTAIGALLGHPYYGVHLLASAGLSVDLMHIVLSHSPRTAIDPATLEAAIVAAADEAAAAAIRSTAVDDLRAV